MRLRSRQEIVADILKQVQEPLIRTRIMYGANLSYSQSKHYLQQMQLSGLILHRNDDTWVATEKGRKILRLYEEAEMTLKCPDISRPVAKNSYYVALTS